MRSILVAFMACLLAHISYAQCVTYDVQIYSVVDEGGPSFVSWVLMDESGDTLYSNSANFSPTIDLSNQQVCLPAGIYTLIFTGNTTLDVGSFLAGVQEGSENIWPINDVVFGLTEFEYVFDTNELVLDCIASFDYAPGDAPGEIVFTSTSITSGTGFVYGWDFTGEIELGDSVETYTYDTLGDYSVCMHIIGTLQDSLAGCYVDTCMTIAVGEWLDPTACASQMMIDTLDCNLYQLYPDTIDPYATLVWSVNGVPFDTTGVFEYLLPGPGIYEIELSITGGFCPDSTLLVDTLYFTPCVISCEAEFAFEETSPGVIQFTNTSAYNFPPTFYWDFGDDSTSNEVDPTHTYAENGTYLVCLSFVSEDCSATYCSQVVITSLPTCLSNELLVSLQGNYNIKGADSGSVIIYDDNENVLFEEPYAITSNSTQYQMTFCLADGCYEIQLTHETEESQVAETIYGTAWDVSLNMIVAAVAIGTNPIFADTAGITLNSDCTDGILHQSLSSLLEVYPNPSDGEVRVQIPQLGGDLSVFDSRGILIFSAHVNQTLMTLPSEHWSSGLYYIVHDLGNNRQVERWSLEK